MERDLGDARLLFRGRVAAEVGGLVGVSAVVTAGLLSRKWDR